MEFYVFRGGVRGTTQIQLSMRSYGRARHTPRDNVAGSPRRRGSAVRSRRDTMDREQLRTADLHRDRLVACVRNAGRFYQGPGVGVVYDEGVIREIRRGE